MWNRKDLKQKAKRAFQSHYWKSVVAALIMMLILGGMGGGSNGGYNHRNAKNNIKKVTKEAVTGGTIGEAGEDIIDENGEVVGEIKDFVDEFKDSFEGISNEEAEKIQEAIDETIDDLDGVENVALAVIIPIVIVAIVIALVVTILVEAVKIFALNVFEIGGRKYFVENHESKAVFKNFIFGFSHGYWKSVKVMFLRDLYTFLWSLLFIIPGIVKAYEYRMIPYLVAEHPEMTSDEAFAKSKEMMNGNKWAAFVLDLSFIGWHILNGFTFGVLGIFHVNPYVYQTEAELYIALRDINISKQGEEPIATEYAGYVEVE